MYRGRFDRFLDQTTTRRELFAWHQENEKERKKSLGSKLFIDGFAMGIFSSKTLQLSTTLAFGAP